MKFKRSTLVLFILLELIAIGWTIIANNSKTVYILNATGKVESIFFTYKFKITELFRLQTEYRKLLDKLQTLYTQKYNCTKLTDTIYTFTLAKVLENSVSHPNNIIVISAGEQQNIKEDDAVISVYGNIIGYVVYVGKKHSAVLSILNTITTISVKHKPSGIIGQLSWDGSDPSTMILEDIPLYVDIKVGDSIVTSGYSQIFPPDLLVGTIKSYETSNAKNTYTIKVALAEDFRKLNYVFVITNKQRENIRQIIKKAQKKLFE